MDLVLASALDLWRHAQFGSAAPLPTSADLADPDADGVPNLLEYALSTSPSQADARKPGLMPNGDSLEFIYTRNLAAVDVIYHVEWSDDLQTWSTTDVSAPTVLSDNGTTQEVKVTLPAGANGKRFVRLKVTRP